MKNTGGDETILSNIQDWIHRRISIVQGSLERMKEVILFVPVIYKSVRWDCSSIYNILHHWLKRMEDVQRNDSLHLHSDKYADQIHKCVLVLERLKKDDYLESFYKEHDERWGQRIDRFEPNEDNQYVKWITSRPNAITERDKQLERKEFLKIAHHEDYLQNQDVEYLFKMIKKHHRHWWT